MMGLESTMPNRAPDAVLFPQGWDHKQPTSSRVHGILDAIEPVLGCKGHIRAVGSGEWNLVTGSPHDTYLFPEGHRYAKFPRYDWFDQPNGLRYGFLKPEDEVGSALAGESAQVRAARQAQPPVMATAGIVAKVNRYAALRDKADRDPAEQTEFDQLRAELAANELTGALIQ